MKKILISGSSGFIGSRIISKLNNEFIFKILKRDNLNEYNFDDFDVIMHLAGIAHDLSNKYEYKDYHESNFVLTKKIFDKFINSKASKFIFFSSIKVFEEVVNLNEKTKLKPSSDYGKTKKLAEDYIIENSKKNKRIYILRPALVYGKNNKGNLDLLIKYSSMKIPWIFGNFKNSRTFCSIEMIIFCVKELILRKIDSDQFIISDNNSISLERLYTIICQSRNIKPRFVKIPKSLFKIVVLISDIIGFGLTQSKFKKITTSLLIDNSKLKSKIPEIKLFNTENEIKKAI